MHKKIKILFTGGGSGGPVVPLLAVAESFKDGDVEMESLWLGTRNGPEKGMIEGAGFKFKAILAGKLRRYFSWKNFTDPIFIKIAFFQSFGIIRKFRPDVVMSAGAFVSVPVVWAAWVLRVPVIIHQQDVRPGLANKLMAPFASVVTTTFETSLKDYSKKARWIGNPMRQDFLTHKLSRREASQKFGLRTEKPIVVVMGGGTGAVAINKLVLGSMHELARFCQVIHITGKGKAGEEYDKLMEEVPNYKYFEFLDKFGLIKAYTVADTIVSRCGMGSLTEMSQLGLKSILIPMPNSHQEDNARVFQDAKAAIVLDEKTLTSEKFIENIKMIIKEQDFGDSLSVNIKKVMKENANEAMVEIIKTIVK